MPNDCIYVIDVFSLMFQVFHAIPPMTGTQGQPTNAVFGFARDLLAILDKQPTHVLCAFDSPGPGKRNECTISTRPIETRCRKTCGLRSRC